VRIGGCKEGNNLVYLLSWLKNKWTDDDMIEYERVSSFNKGQSTGKGFAQGYLAIQGRGGTDR
jgi:hypothetical protein